MKTILIDDEPMALEVLEKMLSSYDDINIIGKYTKHVEALESIKKIKPDVIFLDIQMGEVNGLELGEIFMRELGKVEIVFVTAYSQYAVDAFEINAIDYLLKPIQENRLFKAVERLKENHIKHRKTNISDHSLEVYSFGGFQVLDHVGKHLNWRTQKSKELFAYLWKGNQRPVSKTIIIEDVFPNRDLDKASALIHTTIYQLRKNLEKLGYLNGISFFDESYQLNIPLNSDLSKLKNMIGIRICNEDDIIEILNIYKGDFLEEGYHWAMESQQIYRELVFGLLERFARNQIENEILTPILKMALDKAYEIDPLNESIAEMIIHYYGKQNNRPSLENFFNKYSKKLLEEIDLKPMESTINVYKGYMEG